MRMKIKIMCAILLFLGSTQLANAQRTAYGERMISIDVSLSQFNRTSLGAGLSYGQYLLNSYWFGGLNFVNRVEIHSASGEAVNYPRLQGFGGYMYRLLGSRSRQVNLYGGGDLFIGGEFFDLFKTLTGPTRKAYLEGGVKEAKFIFGLSPRLEGEFFISSAVAITAGIRVPFCILTNFDIPGVEMSLGARVNF